jgi:hypothetical protein
MPRTRAGVRLVLKGALQTALCPLPNRSPHHIVLAKDRDYADISPVAGIILGLREQDVDVQVDVVPRW